MKRFASATSVGAQEAFFVMAGLYAVSMLFGAWIVRVPAEGWKPAGWEPKAHVKPLVTNANVAVDMAWKTPQFWLLWIVLCMNVSAGIGILGQASPMIQDMFGVSAAAMAATMAGAVKARARSIIKSRPRIPVPCDAAQSGSLFARPSDRRRTALEAVT